MKPTKRWLSNLLLTILTIGLGACASSNQPANASTCKLDRERESSIEREATATLFDGQPVRIALIKKHAGHARDYLAVWTPGNAAKPVIVLAHGPRGNIGSASTTDLALALNELGYGTLALQLPVMQKSCEGSDAYPQTFPEALARIDSAAFWLQAKGIKQLALLGHWVGNEYFGQTDDAPFQSWIANGLTGNFRSIGNNKQLRILDIYGSEGNSITLRTAWLRRIWMYFGKTGQQVVVDGANHSFAGKYNEAATVIDQFLRGSAER